MHRAVSRVFRGTCRKWRENDCPIAASEEVKRNQKEKDSSKQKFVPPKHSWEEAVTWTTGLVIGYQLTHRCRSGKGKPTDETSSPTGKSSTGRMCPFSVAPRALSQPGMFGVPTTGLSVNRKTAAVFPSVDLTPFMHDEVRDSSELELLDKLNTSWSTVDSDEDNQDDDIVFTSEQEEKVEVEQKQQSSSSSTSTLTTRSSYSSMLDDPEEYGKRFGADLLSVLGAFHFLNAEAKAKAKGEQLSLNPSSPPLTATPSPAPEKRNAKKTKSKNTKRPSTKVSKDTPMHALELMKAGAELGSARAMYNIGVAYDRLEETKLAREYYQRASDIGHPLATYNCAVFALKDGHLTEGYALMQTASDFGVPEAKEFMKPKPGTSASTSTDSVTVPL